MLSCKAVLAGTAQDFSILTPENRALLHQYELQLQRTGDSMVDGESPKVRAAAYRRFVPALHKALRVPGSFQYSFDSLKFMKQIIPEDKAFRLLNWLIKFEDGTYYYVGAVQMNTRDSLRLLPLADRSSKLDDSTLETAILDSKHWFGALYYSVAVEKIKNQKYYTLLGWNGDNMASDKKVIEVLSFDKSGAISLGAPIFSMEGKIKSRIVFTFAGSSTMLLNYIPEQHLITFDHLAPSDPKMEGKPWTYVPDGDYNYFIFKKGRWEFQEELFKNIKKLKEAGE